MYELALDNDPGDDDGHAAACCCAAVPEAAVGSPDATAVVEADADPFCGSASLLNTTRASYLRRGSRSSYISVTEDASKKAMA